MDTQVSLPLPCAKKSPRCKKFSETVRYTDPNELNRTTYLNKWVTQAPCTRPSYAYQFLTHEEEFGLLLVSTVPAVLQRS
jgi:hypothetical protein